MAGDKNCRVRSAGALVLVFLALSVWRAPLAMAQAHDGADRRARLHGALLSPTADAARGLEVGVLASLRPAAGGGHIAFPAGNRMTVLLTGMLAGAPTGFGGSAAVRLHLRHTDAARWGLAVQAQSMAGVLFQRGEGSGGAAHALALVISSPVRPTRVSLGAALHTMPGSEYQAGWARARDYDLDNPQVTTFVAAERTGRRLGVFAELLWIAMGADEGWDSVLAATAGCKLLLGRSTLSVGAGILVERFGSGRASTRPFPPLATLTVRL